MLAAAVDTLERFFVQKADKPVLFGNVAHYFHSEHVGVHRDVSGSKHRRHFVLGGRNLVMFGFGENSVTPKLFVQIAHKFRNLRFDSAEVMVFKLLSARCRRAEKRPSRQPQILALIILLLGNKEVLLLGPDGCRYFFTLYPEKLQNSFRLLVDRRHRTQQRRFFIQSIARIGNEHRRDIEGASPYERRRRGVPRRVTARHVSRARTARRKAGRVRLPHDKAFARKAHYYFVALRLYKAVVLFRRKSGKGLEPVGVVRCALGHRPLFHCRRYRARNGYVKPVTRLYRCAQRLVNLAGQRLFLNGIVENVFTELFGKIHKNFFLLKFFSCGFKAADVTIRL